ncbi:MAG: UDP-glucose--hexose-1-phosphate uridylyltransferase [Ruminococcaceae bacterium]|nr:UDP-glucose--hexose-1-phosphate uridylyltransferase [Oscillospiraceae bacterium]
MNINRLITELVNYGVSRELIEERDRAFCTARLMKILALDDYEAEECRERRELSEILDDVLDYAAERGLLENNSVVYRDLFDTEIMGVFVARPSDVRARFFDLYKKSPELATDYFYKLSCDSNYIRRDRIARDLKWKFSSEYGDIDITVNLSKPEKDPKAIAAAKKLAQSGYPKCLLCHENEGYAGTVAKPARATLRQIPFDMAGADWYLQYSPYVYYNEHCIALSAKHEPMSINDATFDKLLGFVNCFPHYFIGSNADLPIVGGSILTHDHMQGGRYEFAMERAKIKRKISFKGFENVNSCLLKWPMSVIRISSCDKAELSALASKILAAWRGYTDESAFIFAKTDGEPHNTITPIARRRGGCYELDLVLRNNITTESHPLGVYHPHAEHHNIKRENIGLIEVMGLAVLPARLKDEIAVMSEAISKGKSFREFPEIEKHAEWYDAFAGEYDFTKQDPEEVIKKEIGKTFVRVLSDAGVFKDTPEGDAAFMRFLNSVN